MLRQPSHAQTGIAPSASPRPTSLAMIIGMLPMALGLGEGGEQNAPLGRAVIGGLVVATIATLFFVPTVFSFVHRHGRVAGAPKEKTDGSSGAGHRVEQDRVSCNLNTASEEELGALPALGPDLVRALVEARPFQSWEDLKELAGFEGKTIAALKHGGAYIGWESAGPN